MPIVIQINTVEQYRYKLMHLKHALTMPMKVNFATLLQKLQVAAEAAQLIMAYSALRMAILVTVHAVRAAVRPTLPDVTKDTIVRMLNIVSRLELVIQQKIVWVAIINISIKHVEYMIVLQHVKKDVVNINVSIKKRSGNEN